jgi:hypothetical protein
MEPGLRPRPRRYGTDMTHRWVQLLASTLIAALAMAGAVSFAGPAMSCSCESHHSGASSRCNCGGHSHSATPAVAPLPSGGQDAQSPACTCGSAISDGVEAAITTLPTPSAHDGQDRLPSVDIASPSEPDPAALRARLDGTEIAFPVSILLAAADTGRRAPPAAS